MSARHDVASGGSECAGTTPPTTRASRCKLSLPDRPSPADQRHVQRSPAVLRQRPWPASDPEAVSRSRRRLHRRRVLTPRRYTIQSRRRRGARGNSSPPLNFCLWENYLLSALGPHRRPSHLMQQGAPKWSFLLCGSMAQWLAHLEFELGDPGSIPSSCHYSTR